MNHAMLLRQRGHLPSPTPPLPLPLLPAPTCLEHLLGRIRKGSLPNGGELRLGWKDSDFLTSPRVVTALKRALKHQPVYTTTCNDNNKSSGTSGSGSYAKTGSSIIRRLSIGWRHNLYHHHYLPNPKKQQPQQQQQRQQQQHEALNATVSRNNSRNGSSNRNQSRTTSSSSNTNNSTMSIPASNGNMMRMTLPPLLPPPSSLSSSTVIEIPPPRLSDNPRRVVLAQFLLTMGRTCPHQLESVQLVLNDWLPMAVLQGTSLLT